MFHAVNTLVFMFLAFAWKRDNWTNVCLKFLLLAMACCNAFLMLEHSGYVIRAVSR